MDYYLKQATDADKDLIFAIKRRSIKPYVERVYGWDDKGQRRFVEEAYKTEQIRFIVVNDQAIGFVQVHETAEEIFLANLLIVDVFQGKGLGKIILNDIISRSNKLDKPVRLEVFTVNERAQKFYIQHGFKMTKVDAIKIEMIYLQHEYSGHHH
jgi:ribosomal protein S18 acetylase RimI-like enzyme